MNLILTDQKQIEHREEGLQNERVKQAKRYSNIYFSS